MSQARELPSPSDRFADMPQRRAVLPSWLLSLVFHLGVMVLLGVTLRLSPRPGAAAERIAEVGIIEKHTEGDTEFFVDGAAAGDTDAAAAPDAAETSLQEVLSDHPAPDLSAALPDDSPQVIGPGALEGNGGSVAAEPGVRPGGSGRGAGDLGKGVTQVFGIPGEGTKFVYVFDRSYSMGGPAPRPLDAAKAELIASLKSLDKIHQFQIIFYNDHPERFQERGQPNKLFFATDQNKREAERFIRGITALGGTQHEDALLLALSLQPDVIFFLTDADKPILWPGQLAKIKRRAAGITINAIEFGFGPPGERDNFLKQLARENGGRHAYVNVARLRGGP
jgi:hypothetical protein